MAKVGRNLFDAVRNFQSSNRKPYYLDDEDGSPLKEAAENAERFACRCSGMVKLFSVLFSHGRIWDEAVGEKGKVPTLEELREKCGPDFEPVKSLDEYTEQTRGSLMR